MEAVGGFLRPWNKRAEICCKLLAVEYGFTSEDIQDTLRSLANFVEASSYALAHHAGNMELYGEFLSENFRFYDAGGELGGAHPCVVCAVNPLLLGETPGSPSADDTRASGPAPGSRETAASGRSPPPPPPLPSADATRASGPAPGSRASSASGRSPSPPPGLPSADDTGASGQASGSRASPASGLPLSDVPLVPAQQREPPHVTDLRFVAKRGYRVVCCDECHEVFQGSGVGNFVYRARVVKAAQRRGLWEAGQLPCQWYCLECWSVWADLPVEAMPEYLGFAERDAKRREYQLRKKRMPHRIGFSDERFRSADKKKRTIFCDFQGCLKGCQGVDSGYFVQSNLPPHDQREALWKAGQLNMTFYCKYHYAQEMGRAEPETVAKRREDRSRQQARQWGQHRGGEGGSSSQGWAGWW